jgi:hypothetical protein
VNKDIGISMECRVDGHVSGRLEELIEQLSWPIDKAEFMFKQFYVLAKINNYNKDTIF